MSHEDLQPYDELKGWLPVFSCTVLGEPVPNQRVRHGKGRTYMPAKTRLARKRITLQLADVNKSKTPIFPKGSPVGVKLRFVHTRPNRLMRRKDPSEEIFKPTRPDEDNLTKLIYDSITDAGIWHDDGQVCCKLVVDKYAAKEPNQPYTTIILYRRKDT
tara:strand:+ start:1815 stop:2291 length:477 start_codon:yes stop_codon:yes gene_type:complete